MAAEMCECGIFKGACAKHGDDGSKSSPSLHCPFCGRRAVIEECGGRYLPMCEDEDCIAGDNGANASTLEEAIKLWETRAL